MVKNTLFRNALVLAAATAAAVPAYATITMTSDAANGTNYLGVAGATANMTFNLEAGTSAEATSKGLKATISGDNASRTTVTPSGTSPYGVYSVSPAPYDGNGYFALGNGTDSNGVQNALTLSGAQAYSSISLFIGSLDAYNTVDLLGSTGNVLATYTGTQMAGGATLPYPGNGSAADNRRVTFTADASSQLYGIKMYNTGQSSAFEFDNVSFTAVTAAVPEPASWAMMIVGFGVVGASLRQRRSKLVAA